MATLSKGYTFGATETVTNTKLHNLVDLGSISGIVDADVAAGAAIDSTKLDLATAGYLTTGGDFDVTGMYSFSDLSWANISSLASINNARVQSMMLTSLASLSDVRIKTAVLGSLASISIGHITTLRAGTPAQGDVLYDNGTDIVRLNIGTASQVLKVNSGATAPEWGGAGGYTFVESNTFSTATSTTITETLASGEVARIVFEGIVNAAAFTPEIYFNAQANHRWACSGFGHDGAGNAVAVETAADGGTGTEIEITNQGSANNLDDWDTNAAFLIIIDVSIRNSDTYITFVAVANVANGVSMRFTGHGAYQGGEMTSITLNRAAGTGTITGRNYLYKYAQA